jgi:Tfp pilus assembly protein PilV
VTLDARGLTLVEVLVAAALLAVGLVGVMVVVPIASHGVQEGNQLSTATFLAEQRLEQVRNAPWVSTPANDCLGVGPTAAPTVPAGAACANGATVLAAGAVTFADEASVAGYPGYSRTVRVADCGVTACAGVADADMRRVSVTVGYVPLTGAGVAQGTKSITLTLVVSRR